MTATAACRSGASTAGASPPAAPARSAGPVATGSLTVFAAASLSESFDAEKAELRASHPALSITFDYAGSGTLVAQVRQGAPADVVATADPQSMKELVSAGLVEDPVTFARNRLEILVAPGNPERIRGLADLARAGLRVVLGDDTVPVGRYATRALADAGVEVKPVSREVDVKSAVARVTSGEADASIVYATDVAAAAGRGSGVTIPDSQNVIAEYPMAIVRSTRHHPAAEQFVDAVVRGRGQAVLAAHGFLPI